jgi:hypothetical protein
LGELRDHTVDQASELAAQGARRPSTGSTPPSASRQPLPRHRPPRRPLREAAPAFGMRVAVHDSRKNDPNPVIAFFAAHTGTAPLEASSSQVVGHRLSRAGDRKLNHALYMWRWCRSAGPAPDRPTTGASWLRASRPRKPCAVSKRRLSDAVYCCLLADGSSAVAIRHPRGLLQRRE